MKKQNIKDLDILTLSQTTEYLQLGQRTLYRLVKAKKIPTKKIGGKWLFSKQQLKEWVEKGGEISLS